MDFLGKSYVPTLAVRPSEMNGLEYLPEETKKRMVPCFLLAPWATSTSLEKTMDRIERAFKGKNFILDLDRDYSGGNADGNAQLEFKSLLKPKDCYLNWRNFVAKYPLIYPCIQIHGQSQAELMIQITEFRKLGRPFCVRLERYRPSGNTIEIVAALVSEGAADYAIILEAGWTDDPLSVAVWAQGLISGSLASIDADIPIVVSCTSTPKDYSWVEGVREIPFTNRLLIDQVRAATNRATIVYGDWGSTRPREEAGFGSRPLDRIDYPMAKSWQVARSKQKQWTFQDAAKQIVSNSQIWDGGLKIWGEEMILSTSVNMDLGINTPQKNVASRVNIHLHRQAFFDNPPPAGTVFEEKWQD